MPHIHTEPNQHDHTVTAFIIRDDMDEPHMLLHMHRKLHTLLPPGGHIELDETPWAAMGHELEEESGYSFDDLELIQPRTRLATLKTIVVHPQPILSNTHAMPDNHFHTDLDYLFIAHGEPKHSPKEGESNDIRWLSAHEIAALPPGQIYENVREISQYVFDTLLTSPDFECVPANSYRTDKIQDKE